MFNFLINFFKSFISTDNTPIGLNRVGKYETSVTRFNVPIQTTNAREYVTKYKGKEYVVVRVPVKNMIEFCKKQIEILKKYPAGVDTLSVTGYTMVVKHLEHYEQEIDDGPVEPNPIWAILGAYVQYFTVFQYMVLVELADQVVGTPPERRYQPLPVKHNSKKLV